jgi:hypothetical protein
MDARQSMPGLSRNERDAATAVGFILFAMLVLLCTAVLAAHLLSGLPREMGYGVVFSVAVFTAACAVLFLRSDVPVRHHGPPQLEFRNPPRRRRRRTTKRPLTPQP